MTAEPQPATAQLIDLLHAIRTDWPPHQVDGAIAGAAARGIPWQQVHHQLVHLAVQGGNLHEWQRGLRLTAERGDPAAAHRGAEEARKLLGLEGP